MTEADTPDDPHRPVVLDLSDPADEKLLAALHADAAIEFVDRTVGDSNAAEPFRPRPGGDPGAEAGRWVYYPWRRAVIRVSGPREFRSTRLDRNRYLITDDELAKLSTLRVGVVGLSVGHSIAYALAAEGLCGALRLSDFDVLDVTNLNRVPASVFDIGVNKAVACARRIAELDPYFPVEVMPSGVTPDSIDEFLDGLDIVVEECDSLDVKLLIRDAARSRRLPTLMATSSGGLLDVERFDQEPGRPVFHGLLGDVDAAQLARLSSKEKVPHVLRVIDAAVLRPRMQASLLEVGKTLSTWPQLSSEVAVGAASVAEAVRRIGLGENLPSGRVRVDIPSMLDDIADPADDGGDRARRAGPPPDAHPELDRAATSDALAAIAEAAARAPSGGNSQPWRLIPGDDSVMIRLDPELTSSMDIGYRGSAVAIGAATFNARVAAAAHDLTAAVECRRGEGPFPITAVVRVTPGADPALARRHDAMMRRETNRHAGTAAEIAADVVASLTRSVEDEGARLRLITAGSDIADIASVLAEADRIRYLTPVLHTEMISELRWPGDPLADTGIDVRSLELDDADMAFLEILRNGQVMTHLASWDAGSALGDATNSAVAAASAVAVVSVRGATLCDYVRGGAAMESLWIDAQEHGLAVQPISPAFLYARDRGELDALSPAYSQRLADLQYSLETSLDIEPDESLVLILRLSYAPRPSVPSRRRQMSGRTTRSNCGPT
ncbi:molybdopterin/thiamine biosynthesis adenylyltransferase [Mycolicibacterium iranicum]|uniref:Molybdopterin/thiamine biosynthesis adenylyltransferase n=1 Tax=Mycolicibacterium iranicum TaxID=912594 RepID=A0A839Q9W7_MYCIR|nr:Rv1355c family protein [Mycolicibacterium iranicum]MBB2991624.1 molybdopterin/thiamine biosynthesis adenylyltransferase [Mycolicibacterium iranicum]